MEFKPRFKPGDKVKIVKWGLLNGEIYGPPEELRKLKYLTVIQELRSSRVQLKETNIHLSPDHFKLFKNTKWDEEENA